MILIHIDSIEIAKTKMLDKDTNDIWVVLTVPIRDPSKRYAQLLV